MASLVDFLQDPQVQNNLAQIATQAVAFVLFFWVLKRFAWRPILGVLEERRTRIADDLSRIEGSEQRVNALKKEYEDKLLQMEYQAKTYFQEELNKGRHEAHQILEASRKEAQELVDKAHRSVREELERARMELKQEVVELVFTVSEKFILTQVRSEQNQAMIQKFIQEVEKQ